MNLSVIFICMGAAFLFGLALGPAVIPLMRKLKARQTERDDGPQSHLKKQGTPTIGGLIFLVPIIAVSANVHERERREALDAGMNEFAEKPIFIDRLFAAMAKFL